MVLTHFMPHALEHNFTAMQASAALGVMGAMNIIGTVGSGYLAVYPADIRTSAPHPSSPNNRIQYRSAPK